MLNNKFFFSPHKIRIRNFLFNTRAEQVRGNQIDDALNISTPTACQDVETATAERLHKIYMKAPEFFFPRIYS